jgi:hypothetical protein
MVGFEFFNCKYWAKGSHITAGAVTTVLCKGRGDPSFMGSSVLKAASSDRGLVVSSSGRVFVAS